MFLKKIRLKFLLLLFITSLIPTYVSAYSDYIIAGGDNIGIELKAKNILIVGTYEMDGENPAEKAGLRNGDKIIKVNSSEVTTIDEMIDIINKSTSPEAIKITYQRNNNTYETTLSLVKDSDNIYKTGLYVKDSISGIGTLTFIDPNTKIYGALGHEIIEKNTGQKLEISKDDSKIYSSSVTGIEESSNGHPGEKNARYDSSNIYGNVFENTSSGVFGTYNNIPNKKLYKVAKSENINLGEAKILTVLSENNIEEFTINILRINKNENSNKNLLFEITDKTLLQKAGGIVQGMSGSPIIQGDNIIGAVTHVVVDDPTKGYGIFITTMLEEAEN